MIKLIRRLLGIKELTDWEKKMKLSDTRAWIDKEDFFNDSAIQRQIRDLQNHPIVKRIDMDNVITIDDAEEWLQNERDIWNHPYISDRTDKNAHELAELLADFVNYLQKTCKND